MVDNPFIRAKIHRWYVANAIYFITAVTANRRPLFNDPSTMALLRDTIRSAKEWHPFKMHAYAFMPDHLHLLIFVPETTNISKLMQSIQWNLTQNYKSAHNITTSLSLWQKGFWDHVIRDERDLERHFDYIHYNPVKHGYVSKPGDYPHSSFPEYLRRGWYGPAWGQGAPPVSLDNETFEP